MHRHTRPYLVILTCLVLVVFLPSLRGHDQTTPSPYTLYANGGAFATTITARITSPGINAVVTSPFEVGTGGDVSISPDGNHTSDTDFEIQHHHEFYSLFESADPHDTTITTRTSIAGSTVVINQSNILVHQQSLSTGTGWHCLSEQRARLAGTAEWYAWNDDHEFEVQ